MSKCPSTLCRKGLAETCKWRWFHFVSSLGSLSGEASFLWLSWFPAPSFFIQTLKRVNYGLQSLGPPDYSASLQEARYIHRDRPMNVKKVSRTPTRTTLYCWLNCLAFCPTTPHKTLIWTKEISTLLRCDNSLVEKGFLIEHFWISLDLVPQFHSISDCVLAPCYYFILWLPYWKNLSCSDIWLM